MRASAAGRGRRGGWRQTSGRPLCCACSVHRGEGTTIQIAGHRVQVAAHSKHVVHVRDAGGVPAEGLVELVRALPRVASTQGHMHVVWGERWTAGGGRW